MKPTQALQEAGQSQFSAEQYQAAAEAYLRGVERRIQGDLNPAVASVASLFVSRWDTAVAGRVPGELRDRLGIAVARQAYRAYRELLDSPRWLRLANEGARAQRLLWASTSVKDPEAPDVLYLEALAAPFTVDTMPDHTLAAFADRGIVGDLLPADGGDADQVIAAFAQAGIDAATLAGELQRQGSEAFCGRMAEPAGPDRRPPRAALPVSMEHNRYLSSACCSVFHAARPQSLIPVARPGTRPYQRTKHLPAERSSNRPPLVRSMSAGRNRNMSMTGRSRTQEVWDGA
jgi:Transaldolase/Fructose-6-phosphate aldolase